MKVFLAFVLGALLAVGVVWLISDSNAKHDVKNVGNEVGDGMHKAGQDIKNAVNNVDTSRMKENIKDAGREVVDKTKEVVSDATITASIKAQFATSPDVPAMTIDVDTVDGQVTLSGKVKSVDQVKRAVEIASAVEGVKEVISTLQVKMEAQTPVSGS